MIEALDTDGENPVSKEYRKSTTRMPIDLMTKETPLLFVIPNKKLINT